MLCEYEPHILDSNPFSAGGSINWWKCHEQRKMLQSEHREETKCLKNGSCQGLGKYITESGKILKVNKSLSPYFCLGEPNVNYWHSYRIYHGV